MAEGDTWESRENLQNAGDLLREFEKEYGRDDREVRQQEEIEDNKDYWRGGFPGRYAARRLFGWSDGECYDLPWTGLLTLGDGGCYQWMAVGVRVTPLGRCNNNRTTWERFCQVHDMDTRHLDARHMIPDGHGKYS